MKKKKTSLGDWIFNIFLGLFFTLFTLICIYPFYYLIINTISANDISANGQIMFLPKGIHFQNYIDVFKIPDLASAALVSLGRTVLGTIGAVLGAAYLGFMFTQQKMWARKFWYRFTIITMYFNAGLIPWYITMRNLHLTNNFLAYILPAIVQPFNIILVKTYMESISPALQEAAEIDGASPLAAFPAHYLSAAASFHIISGCTQSDRRPEALRRYRIPIRRRAGILHSFPGILRKQPVF